MERKGTGKGTGKGDSRGVIYNWKCTPLLIALAVMFRTTPSAGNESLHPES